MKYSIYKAEAEDINEIDNMLTELIQDERRYDNNINEEYKVKDYYKNFLNNKNSCILVAKNSNGILGYVFGFIEIYGEVYIEKVAKLDALFVKGEYRRNGIAKALIEDFTEWAKENGASYVELKVCKKNENAVELYQKDGFVQEKVILKKKIAKK